MNRCTVAQFLNRRGSSLECTETVFPRRKRASPADWKSAIQQIGNLRYGQETVHGRTKYGLLSLFLTCRGGEKKNHQSRITTALHDLLRSACINFSHEQSTR